MHAVPSFWGLEDNLEELVLFLHAVSSGDNTLTVKLGSKHCYPQSHVGT